MDDAVDGTQPWRRREGGPLLPVSSVRRSIHAGLGLFAVTSAGPVAAWATGFHLPLGLVVAVTGAVAAACVLNPDPSALTRASLLLCSVAVVGITTDFMTAMWVATATIFGEWTLLRRPPLRRLAPLPPGSRTAALALLVPQWLLPNDHFRNISFELAGAIGLVLVAGIGAGSRRRTSAAVGVAAIHAAASAAAANEHVASIVMRDDPGTFAASLLLMGAALVTFAVVGWASGPGSTWSLSCAEGPLAAVAPGMAWVMVNIGIWTTGLADADSIGYHAWLEGISRLKPGIHQALAATGVPTCVLGLVAIGARLTTDGRAAVPPVLARIALAAGAGALVGGMWTVQLPF